MKQKSRKYFSLSDKYCGILLIVAAIVLFAGSASAVPLAEATDVRSGFDFPLGDVDSSSYDGSGFDAFKPFEAFTSGEILSVSSFTGHSQGSRLEVYLLSEYAYFDGRDPNAANNFGVLDSNGNFISLIDSAFADPLASGETLQGAGEEFTFALQSPEALFSSIDQDNPDDGAPHILAQEVVKDGEVEIDPTTLRSDESLRFSLLSGDIILYIEDMLVTGNQPLLNVPFTGDFDFNDMVVVVRQVDIPEPSAFLLFGVGLFGLRRLRRE